MHRGATAGAVREPSPDQTAEVTPHDGMRVGLHLASGAVHREQRVVEDPHVHRVEARPAALVHIRSRDAVSELEQLRVGDERLKPLQRGNSNAGRTRRGRLLTDDSCEGYANG